MSPRPQEFFGLLDPLIMDIKHYDAEVHRRVAGLPNRQTTENIAAALTSGQELALRLPLIGGFNASAADARGFASLLGSLGVPGQATLELLPYHEYGRQKYVSLGKPYLMDSSAHISQTAFGEFSAILRQTGITLIHT